MPWHVVTETKPIPIRRRNPSIPTKVAELMVHALVDDPEIPIKTAADLKRALAGVL